MAVSHFFPRAEFVRSGYTQTAVDYLAELAKQLQALKDIATAQGDITTLQATVLAQAAEITALQAELDSVELLERPGGALAFAIATSATPKAWTVTATPSENMAAGDFGHVYSNAGAIAVQRADASVTTKPANCFVLAALTSGVAGIVTLSGINSAVVVASPADDVFLSDATPGGWQTGVPTTGGHIIQPLGPAIPSVGVYFNPRGTVEL